MTEINSEREIVARLVDACREAEDSLHRMCRSVQLAGMVSPGDLLALHRWLKQASGSAHQLTHAQQNPEFLQVRDALDTIAQTALRLAPAMGPRQGMALAALGTAIMKLRIQTAKRADARPMARQDVLAALNIRQMHTVGNG